MINLSNNDDIISYLSWAEANNISPFDEETNIYDDMYEVTEEEKNKVKKKTNNNKNRFGG